MKSKKLSKISKLTKTEIFLGICSPTKERFFDRIASYICYAPDIFPHHGDGF
jgi:hypothetical protein